MNPRASRSGAFFLERLLEPEFSERTDARGRLIICRIGEHEGSARVFSAGEQDAKDRAEKQAREKAERAGS